MAIGGVLEKAAGALGVADRVRFLGWRADPSALYRAADVCVFPSRYEPLGNVVIQAWAHGLPVVAAASQGPAALIEDGADGLLVPIDDADALAAAVEAAWTGGPSDRLTVLTGGEPLLQVDAALVDALHARGFAIALETNGTLVAPQGIDWVCVSPKAQAPVVQTRGQELKLVYPQSGVDPARFEGLDFERFLLQPMDGPRRAANTEATIAYCLVHPRWRLSVQTHKYLGIA